MPASQPPSIQIWQIAAPNVVWFLIIALGVLAIILVRVFIRMLPAVVRLHFIRITILVHLLVHMCSGCSMVLITQCTHILNSLQDQHDKVRAEIALKRNPAYVTAESQCADEAD